MERKVISKNRVILSIQVLLCCTLFATDADAFNEEVTHPDITYRAIEISKLNDYLISDLGLQQGVKQVFVYHSNNQGITEMYFPREIYAWLQSGSTEEDDPACRAANHFHDPLKPWNEAKLSDDSIGLALKIRNYCINNGWSYEQRKSNVLWATGLEVNGTPIQENSATNPPSPNTGTLGDVGSQSAFSLTMQRVFDRLAPCPVKHD